MTEAHSKPQTPPGLILTQKPIYMCPKVMDKNEVLFLSTTNYRTIGVYYRMFGVVLDQQSHGVKRTFGCTMSNTQG